ncbi:MAG: HNH endonuclease [Pirellulaceae bacterium]
MDAATREFVRVRAGNRCEYCHLPQEAIDGVLQIEHIVARQHFGTDDVSNLALACDRCNLQKGPNLSAIDPASSSLVPLYQPRTNQWDDHFNLDGASIVGRTAIGRATVRLLQLNDRKRMRLRTLLLARGAWPA